MPENHTPGPWTVEGTSICSGPADGDGYCIAVIEDDGGYEAPFEQRAANAELIASAPDLAAKLQAAEARVKELRDKLFVCDELMCEFRTALTSLLNPGPIPHLSALTKLQPAPNP